MDRTDLFHIGQYPDLKIEILPMTDYQQRGETFSVLGSKYDLFEGIYGPADWKRLCQFLEQIGRAHV